jgi:hypothetical protein
MNAEIASSRRSDAAQTSGDAGVEVLAQRVHLRVAAQRLEVPLGEPRSRRTRNGGDRNSPRSAMVPIRHAVVLPEQRRAGRVVADRRELRGRPSEAERERAALDWRAALVARALLGSG